MKAAAVVVVAVLVVVMVVEGAKHGGKKGQSNKDDKDLKVPKEFSQWDKFNKEFLKHIGIKPSKLKEEEIKPHLYALLKTLDFLSLVEHYLDDNLANVGSEEEARRVFTLLDLFSAQEPLRQRYLKQMREALVSLFKRRPDAAKQTVPAQFILAAYDRHMKARERRSLAVLRRVMVGSPDNINTLVHYRPGRYPALDRSLSRSNISSPFLEVSGKQWYHVKPATSRHLSLSVDLLTWRMLLVKHTFSPTLFRFEPAAVLGKEKWYVLRSAVLAPSAHLSHACSHDQLCFNYEDPVRLQLIPVEGDEVVMTTQQTDGVLFLRDARGSKNPFFRVPEPTVASAYPGRAAHWILEPLNSGSRDRSRDRGRENRDRNKDRGRENRDRGRN